MAERFDIHKDAIGRHAANHLSPVQRAALLTASQPTAIDLNALYEEEGSNLLANLVAQRARLQVDAETAADAGDIAGAVTAEGGIGRNLSLTAKLLGLIIQKHNVTHSSVLLSPDYLKLRQVLVDTLRGFPEAARAVGRALHALESDAATGITERANKARKPEAPLLTIEHEAGPPALPELPEPGAPSAPPPPY